MSVYIVSAECILNNGIDSVEVYRQSYSSKALAMDVCEREKSKGYRVSIREVRL